MHPINDNIDHFSKALNEVANKKNCDLYYNNEKNKVSAKGYALKIKNSLFSKQKSVPINVDKTEDLLKVVNLYQRIIEEKEIEQDVPAYKFDFIDKFNLINKNLCKWAHLRPIKVLDKNNNSFDSIKQEMLKIIKTLESRIRHPEALASFPPEIIGIIAEYDNRVGFIREISETDKTRRERIFQEFNKTLRFHEVSLKIYGFYPENADNLDSETFCTFIFNKLNNALNIKIGIDDGMIEPVDIEELLYRISNFNLNQFVSYLIYPRGLDDQHLFYADSLYSLGGKLYSIPRVIEGAINLRLIYLENNELATIPPEIGRLKNLKAITICDNLLTSLPDELEQLSNLEELTLTNNRLTHLPEGLSKLKKLRFIDVRGNPIDWKSLAKQLHEKNVKILHD